MGRSSWWRSSWAGALSAILTSWIQRNIVWVGWVHEIQTNPCCLGTGCQGLQCKRLGWWKSTYQRSTPMSSTSLAILSRLQVALFHFALLFSESMWCDFIFSVVGVENADGWIIKAFKEAAEVLATQFVTNGVQTCKMKNCSCFSKHYVFSHAMQPPALTKSEWSCWVANRQGSMAWFNADLINEERSEF